MSRDPMVLYFCLKPNLISKAFGKLKLFLTFFLILKMRDMQERGVFVLLTFQNIRKNVTIQEYCFYSFSALLKMKMVQLLILGKAGY